MGWKADAGTIKADGSGGVDFWTADGSLSSYVTDISAVPSNLRKIVAAVPPVLTATVVDATTILVRWLSIFNATTYELYRDGVLIFAGAGNSYTDSNLAQGTTYSYTIKSYNIRAGAGPASAPILAVTPIFSTTRRWTPGHYVAIADFQRVAAGGIPNPTVVSNAGPVSTGVKALVVRYDWNEIETSQNTFDWTRLNKEIAQCATLGVQLFPMIVVRNFAGSNVVGFTGALAGQVTGTLTAAVTNGSYGCLFANDDVRIVTVTGGTHVTWSGALSADPAIHFTASVGGALSGTLTAALANGPHTVLFSNGQLRTVTVANSTAASWTPALSAGVVTAGILTDGVTNLTSNSPLPQYLWNYAQPFTTSLASGGGGWQAWRWSPTLLARYRVLVNAIGTHLDSNPNFGGIATQETSTGSSAGGVASTYTLDGFVGTDAYTSAGYIAAMKKETDYIATACPSARQLLYANFISGTSNNQGTSLLLDLAIYGQTNGVIWGGPDLVTDLEPGQINTRCYTNYTKVHNGTEGVLAPGPTFCSIQSAEWTGQQPAQVGTVNLQDLYNYATSTFTYTTGGARDHSPTAPSTQRSPLNLDIIVTDWHNTGSPSYAIDWRPIIAAHPTFGTVTPA